MAQVCHRWEDINHSYDDAPLFISIIVQIAFSVVYVVIYAIFFRNIDSVSKMHLLVWYINTSTWGWGIYCFCFLVICQGDINTPLCITALSVLGVFGLGGCIEMCCSREGGYFRHQKTMNQCIQYMKDMKETAPIHRIDISCYHYRTTYHTYTDSNGNTQTRTERRRVTTHEEWRNFPYDTWGDSSDYPNLPEISMKWPIVAVESTYIVAPGDDYTLNKFDNFRSNFLAEMRRRDDYIDETITTSVPGHIAQVTAKSEKEGEVPCWLDAGLFYCLAFLFCSCPLRVLFRSRAKKHEFEVRKLYYVNPSRGIGMGNTNITLNVVGNVGTVNIDAADIPMLPYTLEDQGYEVDTNNLAREISINTCPSGHTLRLIKIETGRRWRCNGCTRHRVEEDVWRCDHDKYWDRGGSCDYDICTTCRPAMEDASWREIAINMCVKGHELSLVQNFVERGWRCNGCRITKTEQAVWRCQYDKRSTSGTWGTCDYDICTACRPAIESPPGYATGYNPASAPLPPPPYTASAPLPPPPYNPNLP